MALQGDLDSFALPDVLRLLAGTGKSGRLAITSPAGAGEVWMRDGDLVGGSATTSVYAGRMADVVFELLRFGGGSFAFDEGEQLVEAGERSRVEDTITEAQALVAEWAEVEQVVPSVHARVVLCRELDGDGVHISASEWRTLAAIGGGATVRQLGDRFELTDLAACKQVKVLVEGGLVEFGEYDLDQGYDDEVAAFHAEPDDELAVLRGEQPSVLLETHADALLPEPLPSEGTAFGDDVDEFSPVDGLVHHELEGAAEPVALDAEPVADAWSDDDLGMDDRTVDHEAPMDDPILSAVADPVGWDDASLAELAEPDPTAVGFPGDGAVEETADDRGSLLKFLSTVKP